MSYERIRLRANAKVNYSLDVLGVREDGYHEIRSVFQSISLCDGVEVSRARPGDEAGFTLRVHPDSAGVGPVEKNTVYLAWKAICARIGREMYVAVSLQKTIPTGAGLGGGSADAAALLVGVNALFDLGLTDDELRGVGEEVGADVPFCVSGGTMLGEGTGGELGPLPAPPAHFVAVVKPEVAVSTGRIYAAHDRAGRPPTDDSGAVIEALDASDLHALGRAVGNDLAPVTAAMLPEIGELRDALIGSGALGATMSGSGSTVYGIFSSKSDAEAAVSSFPADTYFTGVYEPVERGVEVVSKG